MKNFFEAAGYLFMVIGGAFSLALLSLGAFAHVYSCVCVTKCFPRIISKIFYFFNRQQGSTLITTYQSAEAKGGKRQEFLRKILTKPRSDRNLNGVGGCGSGGGWGDRYHFEKTQLTYAYHRLQYVPNVRACSYREKNQHDLQTQKKNMIFPNGVARCDAHIRVFWIIVSWSLHGVHVHHSNHFTSTSNTISKQCVFPR